MSLRRNFVMAIALAAMGGCVDAGDGGTATGTAQTQDELDAIGLAKTPASLLVLGGSGGDAARTRVERALDKLGGGVIATSSPRLVIAQVPAGADAILADLGVVSRFDRAVTAADVPGATLDEQRFLDVYSNRWWPQQAPTKLVATRAIRAAGEPFESTALPTDQISVPYASGTIVVSIVLPESNGVAEPSTEDWSEDQIRATELKIESALDNLVQSEPNNRLHFIVNLESKPGHGGLPGTVDTDVEFGKHAQWNDWTNESQATAGVLATILGHPVDPNDLFAAAYEYDLALRNRFHADASYFVIVAADGNYTAGIRAHAWINGPWTVLDTSYGYETFNHEFGHIMGATDEYCPDACIPTTAFQGYLGIFNANAAYLLGGDGIDHGRGEDQISLMNENVPSAINGYTRASWGWLDVDGDGVIDVRDTFPKSALALAATGHAIRATGAIVDQPPERWSGTRYSVNRIDSLEYKIGDASSSPWFAVNLPSDARGQQTVDASLGELPAGARAIWVRAINSAGNVEAAQRLTVTAGGTGNSAPRVRLGVDRAIASTLAKVTLHATGADPDGDAVQYRFDRDGDGSFETPWSYATDATFTPWRAGLIHAGVQARDGKGKTATATTDLYVLAGDASPVVAMSAPPSIVYGTRSYPYSAAAVAQDPEGGALQYRWLVDDATTNFDRHTATDWSSSPSFATTLDTETDLAYTPLDLSVGDATLSNADVRQVIALDANTLAVAGGWRGLWILDVTNRNAPVVLSRLALETTANRLVRDGNKLWVLGSLLTVVDIHDVRAPRELTQLISSKATRTLTDANPQDLIEGQPSYAVVYDDFGAKITDTRVDVSIVHPNPAQLAITLIPPKELGLKSIVLWDHQTAPAGASTLTFTSKTTPALASLAGQFVTSGWQVSVTDDVADGVTGQLVSTTFSFQTSSKAAPVIADAARLLRLDSRTLAVAGDGVQILDASFAQLVLPLATIKGTPAQDAFVIGSRIVWMGPLSVKSKSGTPPPAPPLHGLCVVDASFAFAPRITRAAVDVGGDPLELARVGSRMYVRVQPGGACGKGCGDGSPPTTIVGASQAFASGSSSWQIGATPLRIDPSAFGDDRTVYTISDRGHAAIYDVTSAQSIAQTGDFPRVYGSTLVPLTGFEAVLWAWGTNASFVHFDQVVSWESRVYAITVEARDLAGNVSRAERTIHVIPYDHAPAIASVAITAGATSADTWTFHVVGGDPDAGASWDPLVVARADWDGDGSWDSDWVTLIGDKGATILAADLSTQFAAPGHYNVVFQIRDGFWAQTTRPLGVDVAPGK